jgi:hypothetical protein
MEKEKLKYIKTDTMRYTKEILAVEAIVFIIFWMSNEYLATLMTFIAVPIFFAITIISLIAEKIEKSGVSGAYFRLMIGLMIVPMVIFAIFHIVNGGEYTWLKEN